jgi:hypothetical protein
MIGFGKLGPRPMKPEAGNWVDESGMPIPEKGRDPYMHPSLVLAFVLLAALALAPVSYVALAPDVDPVQVYVGPSHGGPSDGTTPNNDPRQAALAQSATAAPAEPGMTVEAARHLDPMPSTTAKTSVALDPVALRAEPEPADLIAQKIAAMDAAKPSAPDFVAADTTLYARDSARLRAAPSTSAEVVTTLAVDAPLRAAARSTDGAWWRVSLAGGREGYIHQTAVSQTRVVQPAPQPAPTSSMTAASRPASAQPEWKRRSQELFGFVDKSMSWLADQAGGGPAPKVVRSER